MKFNVANSALLPLAQAVNKVINSKNALQILDNFLFTLVGNQLTITGSDNENTMTATLEVSETEGEGSVCIPAKRLLDTLKEVPNMGLTVFVHDQTKEIVIQYLNGQFNFMGLDAADFPQRQADAEEEPQVFTLPANVVARGLDTTMFAVATDSIRPIMTGIFWDIHTDDVTFVSSDTHKLVKYVDQNAAPGLETSFIMPAKPAAILRSIIGKEIENVEVTATSKGASFQVGEFSLSCQFIRGNYPNYNRVIPAENPFTLSVDRVSFLTAMRRVSLFASMASALVKIVISEIGMSLSSRDLDYSYSAEESLTCSYDGNPMTIGFNSQYLIEVLNNLKSEEIAIRLNDPARPGLFVPVDGEENTETVMLLMPMQVVDTF